MKHLFSNLKTLLPGFILIIISIVVYRVWLSFSVFVHGDWAFAFSNTLKDYLYPSAWGVIGGSLLWKLPLITLYGLLGNLGLDFNIVEKILIFWPIIILGPIAGFLIVKKFVNSNVAGFIGSLIFTYNTYFLSIDTQGHEFLPLAFIWGTFGFLSFIFLIEDKKKVLVPLTTLLLFITGFLDLRSLYVIAGIIFFYFLYNQFFIEKKWKESIKKNIISLLSVFLLLLLLNVFWILPNLLTGSLANNEYLNRVIFGSQFYDIQSSLAFFYPYWTGKEPTWLLVQKIPLYFWLYPLLAFSGFIVSKKNKKVLFFGALAILGIFLSKQEAPPFGTIYDFMFSYLPGFSAFREASKFNFVIILSFSILIGSFANFTASYFRNKRLSFVFIFLLALLPLWNTKPLITGEIKTMFDPIKVPQDFVKVKDFISKDYDYSRIVGIDLNARYAFSTNTHPEVDIFSTMPQEVVSYKFNDYRQKEAVKLMNYLRTDEARRLLSASSVGYVSVFLRDEGNLGNIRKDLGKSARYIVEQMDKIPYLVKVNIGTENIVLYALSDFKPHLYITPEPETLKKDVVYSSVGFKMISPSEYHLTIKKLSKPVYLNFTEKYDLNWKLHVGKFSWWKILFDKNYFTSDDNHSRNILNFNQYYLDPKAICSSTSCSIDATLYFKPQSHLYLGLIFSGSVLILVVGLTIYLYKKNEK